MKLRPLKAEDAKYMLEWMHDPFVVSGMRTDFASKTEEDCLKFIESARDTHSDLHLAVATDEDEYMGTVSLKHIRDKEAEFAITVRRLAMGKGFAAFGMKAILELGLQERGLERIYWCVSRKNLRAIRFYEKNGYQRIEPPERAADAYSPREIRQMIWYADGRTK